MGKKTKIGNVDNVGNVDDKQKDGNSVVTNNYLYSHRT